MSAVEEPGEVAVVWGEGWPAADVQFGPVAGGDIGHAGIGPWKECCETLSVTRDLHAVEAQAGARPDCFALARIIEREADQGTAGYAGEGGVMNCIECIDPEASGFGVGPGIYGEAWAEASGAAALPWHSADEWAQVAGLASALESFVSKNDGFSVWSDEWTAEIAWVAGELAGAFFPAVPGHEEQGVFLGEGVGNFFRWILDPDEACGGAMGERGEGGVGLCFAGSSGFSGRGGVLARGGGDGAFIAA